MKNKLLKNFLQVGILLAVVKSVGFLRDIIFAAKLGTSTEADIYMQIFGIATLIFTAYGMALSHINIPTMTIFLVKKNENERKEYINTLYTVFFIVSVLIVLLISLFTPYIIKLLLPGLSSEYNEIAKNVFLIMLPTFLFISFTYISTSILQVHKRFIVTTIIGLPFNFLIISYLLLADIKLEYLALVTTIGWLSQFLIQLPFLLKEKYKLIPSLKKNIYINDIFRKLIPIVIANSVIQVCLITNQAFANDFGEGFASAFSFGSKLFLTITSVFIIAISIVSFPDLSGYNLEKNYDKTRTTLSYIFKIIAFIGLPYLIITTLYSEDLIRIVYMRGNFDNESVINTALGFSLYSFLIFGYLTQEVLTRLFYSMKVYKTPLFIGLGAMILNFIITFVYTSKFGIKGIILTTVFIITLYGILMLLYTIRHIGNFINKNFLIYFSKILLGGLFMIFANLILDKVFVESSYIAIIKIIVLLGLYIVFAYLNGSIRTILSYKTREI